jgi:hypothetical protein
MIRGKEHARIMGVYLENPGLGIEERYIQTQNIRGKEQARIMGNCSEKPGLRREVQDIQTHFYTGIGARKDHGKDILKRGFGSEERSI